MPLTMTLQILALAALFAASLRPFWAKGRLESGSYWPTLGGVMLSSAGLAVWLTLSGWRTDFGTALWATVAASSVVFTAIALVNVQVRGLMVLLMPYLAVLGVLGTLVRGEPFALESASTAWLDIHIGLAVAVTGFLTVAAVSSTALSLQERALKHKQTRWYQPVLPSVSDAETLSGRLLLLVEALMVIGLASGMALNYLETGALLKLDHKTLLSIAAFFLIGALLIGHRVCGVRGRMAARVVLIAYLLVMLASAGVKFITQVLL